MNAIISISIDDEQVELLFSSHICPPYYHSIASLHLFIRWNFNFLDYNLRSYKRLKDKLLFFLSLIYFNELSLENETSVERCHRDGKKTFYITSQHRFPQRPTDDKNLPPTKAVKLELNLPIKQSP